MGKPLSFWVRSALITFEVLTYIAQSYIQFVKVPIVHSVCVCVCVVLGVLGFEDQ